MARYSAKELTYARPLVAALVSDADFCVWLSGDERLREAYHYPSHQSKLRSANMKNPYWFNYWCGTCDSSNKHSCKIGTGIETDILLLFAAATNTIALHVEIKRPGDRLGDGQAQSYPRRAACWADPITRPRTVPHHDEWLTILVHGDSKLTKEELDSFDRIVTHAEVANHITPYPERPSE
jgi:hypothetical protein